jgi:hypothetical protein
LVYNYIHGLLADQDVSGPYTQKGL